MEISEKLACLFTGELTDDGDTYTVEVPAREIEHGNLDVGETVRVAVLSAPHDDSHSPDSAPHTDTDDRTAAANQQSPPVSEGETRVVEIDDIGDQGDGLTRVERGYVVIVPDAGEGERVEIEIESVKQNVAFGTVVDRIE